jgi:hypothetical protein
VYGLPSLGHGRAERLTFCTPNAIGSETVSCASAGVVTDRASTTASSSGRIGMASVLPRLRGRTVTGA